MSEVLEVAHHPRGDRRDWTLDRERTYEQPLAAKPSGLWLSVDDDWRRWCEDEQWNVPLAEPHPFRLDMTRMLWLRSAADIDAFTSKYVGPDVLDHFRIDWTPIAVEYAGICISPYQWSRRLDGNAHWYYGWDCASACVWDLSAVIG